MMNCMLADADGLFWPGFAIALAGIHDVLGFLVGRLLGGPRSNPLKGYQWGSFIAVGFVEVLGNLWVSQSDFKDSTSGTGSDSTSEEPFAKDMLMLSQGLAVFGGLTRFMIYRWKKTHGLRSFVKILPGFTLTERLDLLYLSTVLVGLYALLQS